MPPKQWPTASSSRASAGQLSNATVGRKDASLYTAGVKDPTGKTAEYYSMEDECPVCKSDRYLNPNIRLLISPCYHRMCDSCIDRLYSLGSGPCPICGTQVRKTNFMIQTFEDLVVEKEVVVRRRIAKEFNKRREDFGDLRSYNDYLEEVEDIAFNLINDIETPETEKRLAKLRQDNAAFTALNAQRDARDAMSAQAEEERLWKEQQERSKEARLEEEEERLEREREKKDIIDSLQSSDASAVKLIAKKRAAHKQRDVDSASSALGKIKISRKAASSSTSASTPPQQVRANEPFNALDDNFYAHTDRFILSLSAPPGSAAAASMNSSGGGYYGDPGTDALLRDIGSDVLRAGGYNLSEAQERAIRTSIAGLSLDLVLQD